jgi:hypothetical protein
MKPLRSVISKLFLFLVFILTIGLFSGTDSFSQPVINVPAGDTGALIGAINTANGNADTIINLANSTYVLTAVDNNTDGDTGLPAITANMTINGNGAEITRSTAGGTPDFRIMVFNGAADITLTLNNLTLSNGSIIGEGGGFSNDNSGTVNMNDCIITGNSATGGGNGVNNDTAGIINISNCLITDNDGEGRAGGVINDSNGTVNIADSTITFNNKTSNIFGAGGVANNTSGILNITRSTISNNTNSHNSSVGGVWNNSNGTLNLSESLVSNNSGGSGGGVANNSNGTLNIINTTIKNNSSPLLGGGVYNNSSGSTNIDSCTISGNTAPDGPEINDREDGSGVINILNTIVGENGNDGNCNSSDGIISLGYNIDSGDSCNFNSTGDMVNTDPLLAPLGNNGGPTQTCALAPDSPAINNGNPACPPPDTDQRGFPRPAENRCDIGAFEFGQANIPTLSEWGIVAMAGILGIFGLLMAIRRRKLTA